MGLDKMDLNSALQSSYDNSTEKPMVEVTIANHQVEPSQVNHKLDVSNIAKIETQDTKIITEVGTRIEAGTETIPKLQIKEGSFNNNEDPKENKCLKEANNKMSPDTAVIDEGAKTRNDILKNTKTAIISCGLKTNNAVIDDKDKDITETEEFINSDEGEIKNVKVLDVNKTNIIVIGINKDEGKVILKKTIKIDEANTENGLVLDGNEEKSVIYEDKDDIVITNMNINENAAKDDIAVDLDGNKTDSIVIDDNKDVLITDTINIDKAQSENVIDLVENSDVIILDGNKTDSESTIILDDDETNKAPESLIRSDIEVIDDEKDTGCSIVEASSKLNRKTEYNELYKENTLLTELIEKCLDMENSEGMSRVINRTLLALYRNVEENYKKSYAFKKVIAKAIKNLELEPEKKFSHIKSLCNELKPHTVKKKVPFVTLEKKVGFNEEQSTTSVIPSKRRKVEAIIDLDQSDDEIGNDVIQIEAVKSRKDYLIGKVYPPIEIDDDSDSDVVLENVVSLDNKDNANKENAKKSKQRRRKRLKKITHVKQHIKPTNIDLIGRNQIIDNKVVNNLDISSLYREMVDPNALLEPRLAVEVLTEKQKHEKISVIELQIASLKKIIEELEQAEVDMDNDMSSYVMCEKYKADIVNLYKQLCQITGTEVTKRHEVRLEVLPGHPEGPVRCLEEFLNANIDGAGNPPFPDVQDVTQCVYEANERYKMNWSTSQILSEARALFIQFGRCMQKRRQKREWKNLMSFVKQETPDPAEEDPTLQARLLENTRIAKRNEEELLERFANMERMPTVQSDPGFRLAFNNTEESNSDEDSTDSGVEKNHAALPSVIETNADLPKVTNEINDTNFLKAVNNINASTDPGPTEAGKVVPLKFSAISGIIPPEICEDIVGNIGLGSTITVCGGKIVIQPAIQYGSSDQNTDVEAKSKYDKVLFYLSHHNSFQSNVDKPENSLEASKIASKGTKNGHNSLKTNDLRNSSVDKKIEADLENEIADAENLAKEILSLVQSDRTKTNDINISSGIETAKSTNYNNFAKDEATKNTSGIRNVNISSPDFNQNKAFQLFTVTKSLNHPDVIAPNCTETKEFEPSETLVKEETIGDTFIENVEGIKPEPLDIPSMLQELGKSFTATIFDIEDPFLVIEISDSSESEDEDL